MTTWLRERRQAEEFACLLEESAYERAAEGARAEKQQRTSVDAARREPGRLVGSSFVRDDEVPPPREPSDPVAHDASALPVPALVRGVSRISAEAATRPPRPAAAWSAELRGRLVAALPDAVAESGARHRHDPRHRRSGFDHGSLANRHRLLAAGAGLGAMIVAAGGVAVASSNVMPGNPLYSVKRTVEKVQLDLSSSPTDRGERYLQLAATRIGEIQWLLRGQPGGGLSGTRQQELASELDELCNVVSRGGELLLNEADGHHDQRAGHDLAAFLSEYDAPVKRLSASLPASLRGLSAPTETLMGQLAARLSVIAPVLGGVGPMPGPTSPRPGTPGGTTPSASRAGSSGQTPSSDATPTPTSGSSVHLPIPLPVGTSGVTVPPLLPGLPAIGIGIGGEPSSQPSQSAIGGAPSGDPNPDD